MWLFVARRLNCGPFSMLQACLLSQITVLNNGLAKFDALLMVPVYQAFWITMSMYDIPNHRRRSPV